MKLVCLGGNKNISKYIKILSLKNEDSILKSPALFLNENSFTQIQSLLNGDINNEILSYRVECEDNTIISCNSFKAYFKDKEEKYFIFYSIQQNILDFSCLDKKDTFFVYMPTENDINLTQKELDDILNKFPYLKDKVILLKSEFKSEILSKNFTTFDLDIINNLEDLDLFMQYGIDLFRVKMKTF